MPKDHLRTLLKTGLLGPGSRLESADPRYSCTILTDGTIELTNWPVPLRSLRAATRAAQELIMYGSDIGAQNIRTADPLHFWTYFDDETNRDEKLKRLVASAELMPESKQE